MIHAIICVIMKKKKSMYSHPSFLAIPVKVNQLLISIWRFSMIFMPNLPFLEHELPEPYQMMLSII